MQASLGITLFILFVIVLVLISLFKGLGAILSKSKPNSKEDDPNKTARALTFRIGLSLFLFFSIIAAYLAGWIKPHGLTLEKTKAPEVAP